MRLLLVEDSPRLLRSITTALRQEGYAVDSAGDGEEGLWLAQSNNYDAIILDIMLPKLDGLQVLARLRKEGKDTHVLLLTAKDTVQDRVAGLRQGADDYLIKPFALEELLARVAALCRRSYGRKSEALCFEDLRVDPALKKAWRGDRELELTAREFNLLEYLANRAGAAVSRSEIEEHIYDNRIDPMSNVVDSTVCLLRRKLGQPNLITTRRGFGYCLESGNGSEKDASAS